MRMENYGGMISAGRTLDSSTRVLWQSYQQSHLLAKPYELEKGNNEFALTKYFCSYIKGLFNMP
jgi:hypothetical protein